MVCYFYWCQKCKNQWLFFFKLKHSTLVLGRGTGGRTRQPDLLEMLGDVSANQDEGCKVLQVHSHSILITVLNQCII
jgi:hypothetical protein